MIDLTLDLKKLEDYENKKLEEIDFSKAKTHKNFGVGDAQLKRFRFGDFISTIQMRDAVFIFNLYEKIQNKKFSRSVCFHSNIELFTFEAPLILEDDILMLVFLRDGDGVYKFYEFGQIFLPILEEQISYEIYNPD